MTIPTGGASKAMGATHLRRTIHKFLNIITPAGSPKSNKTKADRPMARSPYSFFCEFTRFRRWKKGRRTRAIARLLRAASSLWPTSGMSFPHENLDRVNDPQRNGCQSSSKAIKRFESMEEGNTAGKKSRVRLTNF